MDKALAYYNMALASAQRGDGLTAQTGFISAVDVDPTHADAWIGLSGVYATSNRFEVAIAAARRAIDLGAGEGAYYNLAMSLSCLGRYDEAAVTFEKCVGIAPGNPSALYHYAQCLYCVGNFRKSITMYDRVLALKPGDADAIDQRGLSILALGRYREGLIENKERWNVLAVHPLMHSDVAEWKGESLKGKSIIVLHEQGFGDSFQFIRFVPWLKKLGAKHVVLSVRQEMMDLCRVNNLADEVIGIRDLPEDGLEAIDYKVPMMTLAAGLDITVDDIPGQAYLSAPMRKPRLPEDSRLKVGLVWAGKPMYAQDRWRSMPVTTLLPLVENPNIAFYSLQTDRQRDLNESGLRAFIKDMSADLYDWSDTAALMKELDVLVSVDTAPAHLAGALGIPVALMIPQASCWRWLAHTTIATPWYDSMTLHRQERQGDWTPVIQSVSDYLERRRSLK